MRKTTTDQMTNGSNQPWLNWGHSTDTDSCTSGET